jgi:hypothetical protein
MPADWLGTSSTHGHVIHKGRSGGSSKWGHRVKFQKQDATTGHNVNQFVSQSQMALKHGGNPFVAGY